MGGVKFKQEWVETYQWASMKKGDRARVICTICHCDFLCDKGIYELNRHKIFETHVNNVKKRGNATNPVTGAKLKDNSIVDAMKKSETRAVEQRRPKMML